MAIWSPGLTLVVPCSVRLPAPMPPFIFSIPPQVPQVHMNAELRQFVEDVIKSVPYAGLKNVGSDENSQLTSLFVTGNKGRGMSEEEKVCSLFTPGARLKTSGCKPKPFAKFADSRRCCFHACC